jgi:hypothetical protein
MEKECSKLLLQNYHLLIWLGVKEQCILQKIRQIKEIRKGLISIRVYLFWGNLSFLIN